MLRTLAISLTVQPRLVSRTTSRWRGVNVSIVDFILSDMRISPAFYGWKALICAWHFSLPRGVNQIDATLLMGVHPSVCEKSLDFRHLLSAWRNFLTAPGGEVTRVLRESPHLDVFTNARPLISAVTLRDY